MSKLRLALVAAVALAALVAGASCNDSNLEPIQPPDPPGVDNKLALEGSICTRTPRDELFPVKILFIIDTSDSMSITDPAAQRVSAVMQVIDRYRGNPSVKFGVVAFDSRINVLTRDGNGFPGFTANPDVSTIDQYLRAPDMATDYQGALATAYTVLFQDMAQSSPEERARSKYVVIFFSDGNPDPQCWADPARSGDEPLICDLQKEEWPDELNPPAGYSMEEFQAMFVDLESEKDYNSDDQIVRKVEDIMELQEIFNVNELRFHTAFLFDPAVAAGPFAQAFQLDRDQGIALMTRMKDVGNGTFTEFTSGGQISFLNVNYTSVKKTYGMNNLIVFNHSALPTALGVVPDSDGDGLPDTEEDELRLCAYDAGGPACANVTATDSDGDGYTDLFEDRLRSSGFDPKGTSGLTAACDDPSDMDMDGLRNCEEAFLQTNPRLFDSDGDRIPDGLEFLLRLDPLDGSDARADNDADGRRNMEELLLHWTPGSKEPPEQLPTRYKTSIEQTSQEADGRNCFRFDVSNIDLVTTRASGADRRGMNTIWVYFLEGPPNDPRDYGALRLACVEARYVEPDLKVPANGHLVLTEDDFFDPMNEPPKPCVGPLPREEEDAAGDGTGDGSP